MIVEIGLVLISIAWIMQALRMKKNELDKYSFAAYVIGAALLSINGFIDGVVGVTDALEALTLITSVIVLFKLMQKKK
jgi:hypothetical protein